MAWRIGFCLLLCVSIINAYDVRFFLHIPKTGGTTFRHIFAMDCSRTWTFFAESPGKVEDAHFISGLVTRNNYTCFQGHMTWDLVRAVSETLTTKSIASFVLFREPTTRLISQYYYDQVLHNTSYDANAFFSANGNVIKKYLGGNASQVIEESATFVGITEFYHETLSYLLAVGFINNRNEVVNYNTRKVHQKTPLSDLFQLADENTIEDRHLYQLAMKRLSVEELMSVVHDQNYHQVLDELNSNLHECKNDEEEIGSGKCRQK